MQRRMEICRVWINIFLFNSLFSCLNSLQFLKKKQIRYASQIIEFNKRIFSHQRQQKLYPRMIDWIFEMTTIILEIFDDDENFWNLDGIQNFLIIYTAFEFWQFYEWILSKHPIIKISNANLFVYYHKLLEIDIKNLFSIEKINYTIICQRWFYFSLRIYKIQKKNSQLNIYLFMTAAIFSDSSTRFAFFSSSFLTFFSLACFVFNSFAFNCSEIFFFLSFSSLVLKTCSIKAFLLLKTLPLTLRYNSWYICLSSFFASLYFFNNLLKICNLLIQCILVGALASLVPLLEPKPCALPLNLAIFLNLALNLEWTATGFLTMTPSLMSFLIPAPKLMVKGIIQSKNLVVEGSYW